MSAMSKLPVGFNHVRSPKGLGMSKLEVINPSNPSRSLTICMAHPRRVVKVAKQIEREIGSLLLYDKVMQEAICPERRRGLDGAVSALASVTEVELSNDLQVAKVFLSIYSDDLGKESAIRSLKNLEGYARKHIGRQIRLRLTPEIRFVMDESIERSERVYKLLEQVKKIQSGEAEPPPIALGDEYDSDEDYEDEDDEEEEEEEEEEINVFKEEFRAAARSGRIDSVDLGFFGAPAQQKKTGRSNPQRRGGTNKRAPAKAAVKKSSTRDDDDLKAGGEIDAREVAEIMELFNEIDK